MRAPPDSIGQSHHRTADHASGRAIHFSVSVCPAYASGHGVRRPCVAGFDYGRQSTYLWDDDLGVVHQIPQTEGGEQGDPLMPLLFALGIHAALQAAQLNLPHEILMAFLDDVYIASSPLRVGHSFAVLQEQLLRHSNIRVHLGKIKVWNSSGVRPRACDTFQDIATASGSFDQVWKGSQMPTDQQGIKVVGTPFSSFGARVAESPDVVGAHPSCSGRAVRMGSAPPQRCQQSELPVARCEA